jgi:hypothetical protein
VATTIYSENYSVESWWFFTKTATEYSDRTDRVYRYPYPKAGITEKTYLNKTWDTVASAWVMWETKYPDPKGASYPGPGTFGVDTSDYRFETEILSRFQL